MSAEGRAGPPPEFSRPVAADKVGRDGMEIEIEASESERAALARRFGLLALGALAARGRLRPVAGGMIELRCRFE
ncbi:MAG: YceD family protein, partial [Rhodospirillales bacterium]